MILIGCLSCQFLLAKANPEIFQFIAVRKTLEANMRMSHTFPPGRILWALRESDLHPSHRIETSKILDKLRLFEVLDVAEVFSQIVFAKDMLG